MASKRMRAVELMRSIFKSPTMFALGVDPKTGMLHGCIKGEGFERKWSEPATPQIRAVLAVIQSLLGQ